MTHRRHPPLILLILLLTLAFGCASAQPGDSDEGSSDTADASVEGDTSSTADTSQTQGEDTSGGTSAQEDSGAPPDTAPGPECTRDSDCDDDEHCAQETCQPGPCPEAQRNACGGCAPLRGALGDSCGVCGTWECGDDGQATCAGDELNGCGTCGPLEAEPDSPCDDCGGAWLCTGDGTAVVCSNDDTTVTRNLCGQCQPVSLDLGEPCACGGEVVCVAERELAICDDGDNTPDVATALPDTDDDSNWVERTGSLNTVLDEDWYRVRVEDGFFDNLEPEFELIVPPGHDFDLCVYYARDEGNPSDLRCDGSIRVLGEEGTYTIDRESIPGCCMRQRGNQTEEFSLYWSTPLGEDDGGEAFIRVIYIDGADDCAEYRLRYRF